MNKIAIVTTSSDKYFHLLQELIDSIRSFKESKKVDICLIDYDLSSKNINIIKKKVNQVSKVKKFLNNNDAIPFEYIQMFLPKYFPKYEKYIWIDADCWINSWSGIEMLINASNNNYFAISSMGDRHCPRTIIRVDWLFRNIGLVKSQNIKHSIKLGLPIHEARLLGLKNHLNAGVFALNKKSKFWTSWINNFKKLKGPSYGRAQLAMNYSVYISKNKTNILPNYINCLIENGVAVFDEKKKKFVEEYYPYNEIGIIHLAGKKERFKNTKVRFKTLQGKYIFKSIRYRD